MKNILFIFLCILTSQLHAQDSAADNKAADTLTYDKLERESYFPGGDQAWRNYLMAHMRYPANAIANNIEGIVIIQFVVDKEGNVSDITAKSGPVTGGLREEAIRLIQRSGKWIPAWQHGRYVKSYKQ